MNSRWAQLVAWFRGQPSPTETPRMDQAGTEKLLQVMLGPEAKFRPGQWEAIDRVANARGRLLLVQCTGWGKSVVYFLATKILRDLGAGPTLLISPLLSLMRNQVAAAERLGIHAAAIHSGNWDQWDEVSVALRENVCDVLLVAPERLGNAEFLEKVLPRFQGSPGLFVVDEAHCISDWGHDFRPDYRRIVRLLRLLPRQAPVLCTTATANDRVVQDILSQIPNLEILRGPLARPSLKLYNIKLADQAERLAWLAHFIPQLPGSGIIYCLTVQDSRRVAAWLARNGIPTRPYHADLPGAERVAAEQALLANEVKALVATVALGMGFDKPDLGFVVHFQRPGSVVAYYQQVGRAGRAVQSAYGVLLSGSEDDEIQDYFIRTAFPPPEVMLGVLETLEAGSGATNEQICAALNQSYGAIEKALKLLEVDGAVRREKSLYHRTANPWRADAARAELITARRRAELEEVRQYVDHSGCLMEFLARALDDPAPAPCGKCMNCTGRTTRRAAPDEVVRRAIEFLRGDTLTLEPRVRWPRSVLAQVQAELPDAVEAADGGGYKVSIPERLRAAEGRILCIYDDAGWGREVARGKYQTGEFSDALVAAAATLIQRHWRPAPAPEWVTAAPSQRRAALVQSFAQRLAGKLGLPFHTVLARTHATCQQKEMLNSVQQVRNLLGGFTVNGLVPSGPVLLVDDVVDSGWTLTLLAIVLRRSGSGPVHPFALAKASPRGG